eukprot:jgi/Undpi1/4485/HiC_scaffold_17.g07839.m1
MLYAVCCMWSSRCCPDSGYLVYQALAAYDNPNTSFVLSNDVYKYPDIYVCLYDFYGCDDFELEGDCMGSFQSTEGGNSNAIFNLNRDNEQDLQVDALLTEERGWCVTFAASEIVVSEGERDAEDYVLLNMFWYPGGSASGSTTCIDEEGGWESHSESVFIHLRDVDTGIYSAGIQVSYSCMTSASDRHISSHVGIGLTKENKLKSDNTAVYKAVSTSSAIYKDKRDSHITEIASPYAWLSLEVAQVTDSLEEITEIDPLEIAEILGNIGGFWDLLLLLWPVFFVAATREDPHLKGRNFRKSVTRGSERVAGLSKPIRRSGSSLVHRGELARRTAPESDSERPKWDTPDASAREQEETRLRSSTKSSRESQDVGPDTQLQGVPADQGLGALGSPRCVAPPASPSSRYASAASISSSRPASATFPSASESQEVDHEAQLATGGGGLDRGLGALETPLCVAPPASPSSRCPSPVSPRDGRGSLILS